MRKGPFGEDCIVASYMKQNHVDQNIQLAFYNYNISSEYILCLYRYIIIIL